MIYFGIVSMLVVPSLAQAAFVVTATPGNGTLPVVETFTTPQATFDPLVITSAQIGESFTGQTVSIHLPGDSFSPNGWEQVTGAPSGPLSLQTAIGTGGVITWTGQHLQGLLSDTQSVIPHIGEGAISILFDCDQVEFGLDFLLTNSGDITLQFFKSSGVAFTPITSTYSGSYSFTSDDTFAGVTITHKDDSSGIAIDNLRYAVCVPEPTLGILLGISLMGLVGAGAVRKLKQRKIANS